MFVVKGSSDSDCGSAVFKDEASSQVSLAFTQTSVSARGKTLAPVFHCGSPDCVWTGHSESRCHTLQLILSNRGGEFNKSMFPLVVNQVQTTQAGIRTEPKLTGSKENGDAPQNLHLTTQCINMQQEEFEFLP